ncbi:MAG: hypothetical protein J6R35_01495 [Clostridia bacterium]|nr:hypothetical protein [Clostridia bacterium]
MTKRKALLISIIVLCVALAATIGVATYAYWQKQTEDIIDVQIPTTDFNPSLKYIVFEGVDANGNLTDTNPVAYAVVGYSGLIGELVIPSEHLGLKVTKITTSPTQTNTNLAGNQIVTSMIIPESVTEIDTAVCANMVVLKSVTIQGEGEITIQNLAFAGCVELDTFTSSRSAINGDRNSYLLNTPAN